MYICIYFIFVQYVYLLNLANLAAFFSASAASTRAENKQKQKQKQDTNKINKQI
jgi:hypothetical protein